MVEIINSAEETTDNNKIVEPIRHNVHVLVS